MTAGDHLILGLKPGTTLSDADARLLAAVRPAGVILFKSNFDHHAPYKDWIATHKTLIDAVRNAARRDTLLIGIDHEGGRVCRTPPPITRFTYAARWGAHSADVATIMADELASLGINLSFAPVADINSNPDNPVIGERAFGTTVDAVIDGAVPFMQALMAGGVLACAKHFPGHGDTSVDSHLALPVLDQDLSALAARELAPFGALVDAGVPMVMTSHILFPQIDPGVPATLSRRIITDVLREQLGFGGVVVSDDIGMRAMDGFFEDPASIVPFMRAGNDLLMICSHGTNTDRAYGFAEALDRATATGDIAPALLDASKARVDALLSRAATHPVRQLDPPPAHNPALDELLFTGATKEVV